MKGLFVRLNLSLLWSLAVNDPYYPVQHTQSNHAMAAPSPHNRWVIFFLALFFGTLGVHRFAAGKILTGLLMLFTFGGFGFWWAYDVFMILLGQFTDSNGLRIGGATTHEYNQQLMHQQYQPQRQIPQQQQQQPQHGYGQWGGEDGDLDAFAEEDPLEAKFAELEKEMRRKGQRID